MKFSTKICVIDDAEAKDRQKKLGVVPIDNFFPKPDSISVIKNDFEDVHEYLYS